MEDEAELAASRWWLIFFFLLPTSYYDYDLDEPILEKIT